MKISVNWIKEYLQFDLPSNDEVVKRIGAQLGGVEETIDLAAKYQGIVVVKVVECSPLENSDHLNLCFIDDGGVVQNVERREDGLVQVVCGAPNVSAGVFVAWLPPGATVPSTYDTDPFVLEARALRGAVSNGMLASPKELAIGESHEGLLLLEDTFKPGTDFAEAYGLNDFIIDVENKMFTHRPDCFGQLGVAREVAGIFGQQFMSPDWYSAPTMPAGGSGLALTVANEATKDVPRFMAVTMDNISIAPSPIWLQTHLSRVGIRPINNVVDITNYMMMLTGQPLHAYDYDKVAALSSGDGARMVVRYPHEGEQIELLSGKTVTPRSEAILIATDQQAIGLGGVMGGANTEVDETTTRIILECANFDMYSIRRTSMAHGLFTDAVTRYNKGQSALQNPAVVAKTLGLLAEFAGGSVASDVIDDTHDLMAQSIVTITTDFVNVRLGFDLSAAEMAKLLTNVEFSVEYTDAGLTTKAPFWRTDIAIREDIVEEIGRLYGFDKLPLELPRRDITPAPKDPLILQKTAIRNSLVKAGANEVLTYSFLHGDLLDKVQQDKAKAFSLSNALSPDLQYFRFSAVPSLLDKVHGNIKAGHGSFALFELSKGHAIADVAEDGLPTESELLDFVYASKHDEAGAAYYRAQVYLQTILNDLGVSVELAPIEALPDDPIAQPYDPNRSALVKVVESGIVLGIIGEFKVAVQKALKLPKNCAGFTISRTDLLQASGEYSRYQALPKFPKIEQDICLRVADSVAYGDLLKLVTTTIDAEKPEHTRLTLGLLDIYKRDDEVDYKQITFRVSLASFERTMTDQEVTVMLQSVAEQAAQTFDAARV